jgi:hypothetical protein
VKRLLLVNGTAWHKATKCSKEEHPDNFINSKFVPKTQLQMEHFAIKDGSRISFIDSLETSRVSKCSILGQVF